jgi:ribosome-associated protein
MIDKSFSLLHTIVQLIYDKKGMNIIALDVKGISSISDFVVIAEGTVDRHISAIAGVIVHEMKMKNIHPLYLEGVKSADWVVLDYGEVMVHIFTPSMREKYRIERLWMDSKIVDLPIDIVD